MSDLSNYSIETDHTVLLSFKDGRRLRVPLGELGRHLGADDLARITRAVKLRRDFIRRHMPKAVLVLVAGGLIALAATTTTRVAAWMSHHPAAPTAPAPAAPENEQPRVVRNVPPAAPSPAPSPAAVVKDAPITRATTGGHAKATVAKTHKTAVQLAGTITTPSGSAQVTLPVPLPSPAPISGGVPASPSPSPSPSVTPAPTPTVTPIPNQGQVLGDSTGPPPKPVNH